MAVPQKIDPQSWKEDLAAFRQKTEEFYAGNMDKMAYKGFSGLYGSYAQRGGKANILRLRMTAGRVTPEKLAFARSIAFRLRPGLSSSRKCSRLAPRSSARQTHSR